MAEVPASLETIARLARALEDARLPYAFIGGVALNAWGVPRATFDLDVALAAEGEALSALLHRLEQADFVLEETFQRGFRDRVADMEKVHLYLPTGSSLMAIDLFLAATPFLRSVIERRVEIDLGTSRIHVCTAADLILFKLIADRPKDRVDTSNVIVVQGVPERGYLERWAAELGLRERLADLLGRSSP